MGCVSFVQDLSSFGSGGGFGRWGEFVPGEFRSLRKFRIESPVCHSTILMATSSKVGAKMSANLGLCVGSGSGCPADDLWRGLGVFISARKVFGWNRRRVGITGFAGSLDSVESDSLYEGKFCPLQRRSRFRDVVVRLQDLSGTALGGRRMSRFAEHVPIGGSRRNSVWPLFSHRSEESPRIIPSSHQNGQADDMESPPLFMKSINKGGNQLKRFSHFKDGIVHYRYLEVKKDWRNRGQEVLLRDEESSSPGTVIYDDSNAVDIDDDSSDLTVICFDIETTGFSPVNDRIIEFAARDLAGGLCSTIETLVNPEMEVRNERIHNISSRMVNHGGVPKWKDVALALVDFVESRRKGHGPVILVAHNGKRFDVPFIMSEFLSCGVSMPSYWRFADSMALARLAMKASRKSPPKAAALGQLVDYYNLPSVGKAHRAMADVNMLAQVLQMLMNDLEMGTSELLEQSFTVDEVLKGEDSSPSKREIGKSSEVVDEELDSRRLVDNVNESGSGSSAPWDLISVDSAGRSNEDEFEFGEGWKFPSQQFPDQVNDTSFTLPGLGFLESGTSKKITRQHVSRAGATPLMRKPPIVGRTPAVLPKKVDVQRDIKTQ